MCELVIEQGFHYIFTCLPESHIALYDWLKYLDANEEINHHQLRKRHGRDWHFYNYRSCQVQSYPTPAIPQNQHTKQYNDELDRKSQQKMGTMQVTIRKASSKDIQSWKL